MLGGFGQLAVYLALKPRRVRRGQGGGSVEVSGSPPLGVLGCSGKPRQSTTSSNSSRKRGTVLCSATKQNGHTKSEYRRSVTATRHFFGDAVGAGNCAPAPMCRTMSSCSFGYFAFNLPSSSSADFDVAATASKSVR